MREMRYKAWKWQKCRIHLIFCRPLATLLTLIDCGPIQIVRVLKWQTAWTKKYFYFAENHVLLHSNSICIPCFKEICTFDPFFYDFSTLFTALLVKKWMKYLQCCSYLYSDKLLCLVEIKMVGIKIVGIKMLKCWNHNYWVLTREQVLCINATVMIFIFYHFHS